MKMNIGKWMTTLALAALCFSFTIGPIPEEIKRKRITGDSLTMSTQQLLKFCGEYLPTGPDPRMAKMRVVLRDGILYRHVYHTYVALNPVSATKFVYDDNSGRSLEFVFDKKGQVKEVIVARPDGEFRLTRDAGSVPVELAHFKYGISERITELMKKYASIGQFNGTVLVARKGETIYKEAFGKANIELGVPNQMDTKYRLASLSKQFTAMLILQLADQRKLSLQVPIMYYLPDYPKEQGRKITIHHLLSHSSGIPDFTSFPDYETRLMKNKFSPEALVKQFASLPLDFEPGTKFGYSNSGYVLLGYIIEKITGKSYEQNLQDNIFKPLKMYNSGYDHNQTLLPKRAAGYDKKGNSYVNAEYIDMSVPYSAGAIIQR